MVASAGRRGGGQAFIQRRDRAYRGASRMLTGHGRRTQAEWLRELAGCVELNSGGIDPLPDHYGAGPQVTELEQEVAALLGKPAAVLMPSGNHGPAGRAARLGRTVRPHHGRPAPQESLPRP
jgi:hypothetical protein